MNLRGEILTVMDLCPILKMSASKLPTKKVVVLDCGGSIAGVGIDDICELVYADRAQIAPHTLAADASASEYLRGTVAYGNYVMSISRRCKTSKEPGVGRKRRNLRRSMSKLKLKYLSLIASTLPLAVSGGGCSRPR